MMSFYNAGFILSTKKCPDFAILTKLNIQNSIFLYFFTIKTARTIDKIIQEGMYIWASSTGRPNRLYTIGRDIIFLIDNTDPGNKKISLSKMLPSGMYPPKSKKPAESIIVVTIFFTYNETKKVKSAKNNPAKYIIKK